MKIKPLAIHVVSGMLRVTEIVGLHKTRAVGCRVSDSILSSVDLCELRQRQIADNRAITANGRGVGDVLARLHTLI